MSESDFPALRIENLTLERTRGGEEEAIRLRHVSLSVEAGQVCVLAGESGSGKSALCRLLFGVRQAGTRVRTGTIEFEGRDLLPMRPRERRRLQREAMCFVGSRPEEAFDPDRTVRQSLTEYARLVGRTAAKGSERDWSEAFYQVGIVEPERILPLPVRELSTIVVQRLALMRALISGARLLVCDEATAGLDRVAESEFLSIVEQLHEEHGLTVLLATGSLRGVERFADQVAIFFEGGILETGDALRICSDPGFRYTREFLGTTPRLTRLRREIETISREALEEAGAAIHGPDDVSSASAAAGSTG